MQLSLWGTTRDSPQQRRRIRQSRRCAPAPIVLAIVLVPLTLPVDSARAQAGKVDAALRSQLYQDDDRTTIVTSSAEASGQVTDSWGVGARYVLDVVSSASVDVVSQATGRFEEQRHEAAGDVRYGQPDSGSPSAQVGYAYSTEHDWRSHNVNVAGSVDMLDRNLMLNAALGFQTNAISRAGTYGFERDLRAYLSTLSATYTATPVDLFHLALSASYYDGFLSSPYRYLTIRTRGYAEALPDERVRAALLLRHHHYLGDGIALRSHLRGYVDSFGVKAMTAGAELARERPTYELAGWVRAYAQLPADFYREIYPSQERYMTLDKELSTFADVFAGGTLRWSLRELGLPALRLEAELAGFYFHFFDFAALTRRLGLLASLGITLAL